MLIHFTYHLIATTRFGLKMCEVLWISLVTMAAAIVGWLLKPGIPPPRKMTPFLHQKHPTQLIFRQSIVDGIKEAFSSSSTFHLVFFNKPVPSWKVLPPGWLISDLSTVSLLLSSEFSTFLQLLGSATQTIDIATYILTGHFILTALRETMKRGVKVRVVVDDYQQSQKVGKSFSKDGVRGQTLAVAELIRHGIRVRNYTGESRTSQEAALLRKEEREARFGGHRTHFVPVRERKPSRALSMFHRKYVIVDSRIVMFGSINISEDSFASHYEDFIITNDQSFVKPLSAQFQDTWNDFRI